MAWWPWETTREALARQRDAFERTLAVLREENATFRRMVESSNARADGLALDLARSVVTQPTPVAPLAPSLPPRRTSRDPIHGLGNVLEPVAFGHPDGMFPTAAAASLMAAEDEPDAAAAA